MPDYQLMQRVIAFDTETTGLQSHEGHRIVSFAAVEMVWDEKNPRGGLIPTGRVLDLRFNPERELDPAAARVNGFTLEKLQNEPKFIDCASKIINFIKGPAGEPPAVLVAHNARFDVGMMNAEMRRAGRYEWIKEADVAGIIDTKHASARQWLGQKDENGKRLSHSLDAVCTRLGVDLSPRNDGHGALVDTKLLADALQQMMTLQGGHRSIAGAGLYRGEMSSPRSTSDYTGNLKREFSKEWIAAAAVVAPHLAENDKFKLKLSNWPRQFIANPQTQATYTIAIGEAIEAALTSAAGKNLPDEAKEMLLSIQHQAQDPKTNSTGAEQFAQLCQQMLVDSLPTQDGKPLNSRLFYLQDSETDRIYGKGSVVTFVAGLTGKAAVEITSGEVAQSLMSSMSGNVMALGRLMNDPAEVVEAHISAMTESKCSIRYLGKQFVKGFSNDVKTDVCTELGDSAPKDAQAAFLAAMQKAFSPSSEKVLGGREIMAQDLPPAALLQAVITTAQRVVNPGVGLGGEKMHRAALELEKALREMEAELRIEVARRICDPATPPSGPSLLDLAQKIAPCSYEQAGHDPSADSFLDCVQNILVDACSRTPAHVADAANRVFEQRVLRQGNFKAIIDSAEQAIREQSNALLQQQSRASNPVQGASPAFQAGETYVPPTAVVRMLLPKEQFPLHTQERQLFRDLQDAIKETSRANDFYEAALVRADPAPGEKMQGELLRTDVKLLEAGQQEAGCRTRHQAAHGEFLDALKQAASTHVTAIQEDRDGYFARFWKEQMGVKREQLPKERVELVEESHEAILEKLNSLVQSGQSVEQAIGEDMHAYADTLEATFHEINPTLPQSASFCGYPMSLGQQDAPKTAPQRAQPDAPKPSGLKI